MDALPHRPPSRGGIAPAGPHRDAAAAAAEGADVAAAGAAGAAVRSTNSGVSGAHLHGAPLCPSSASVLHMHRNPATHVSPCSQMFQAWTMPPPVTEADGAPAPA